MAITVNSAPSGSPSAQDNLWHVVTSDASGSPDMRYVFDVWVSGQQVVRVKQYPDPVTGRAYFDAGPVIRNQFTYEWFEPLGTAYVAQPDASGQMALTYQIRYGEDVSGITTANVASGNVTAYNYCPPLFKRRVDTIADKLNKWLTDRPLVLSAGLGENIYLPFYTDDTLELEVELYNHSNQLIDQEGDPSSVTVPDNFQQMNIGSDAVATRLGVTINSSVKYYLVGFKGYDKVRVNLVCNPKYDVVPIHFVNRWGMWETLRFDLASRLILDTERKSFQGRDYRIGTGVEYITAANRYHESKVNYLNRADYTYRLTADAMTDADWLWAAQLIYSPQMLMEVDGYFYPVTIKTSNYEVSKHVNNKLRPLEVDVEINQTRYSHLR